MDHWFGRGLYNELSLAPAKILCMKKVIKQYGNTWNKSSKLGKENIFKANIKSENGFGHLS